MITLHKTHGIKKLKSAWMELEKADGVTPFLYYDYMKNVTWNSWLRLSVPVFFYGKEEKGKVVFIAPMRYGLLNKTYDTLGNLGYCDITDFLFSDSLREEEKRDVLQQMIKKIGKPFCMSRIMADSETLFLLDGRVEQKYIVPCVNIHLPEDYDSHIATLSKSVRQNIRTAYNRMTKNDATYEFKFFVGGANIPDEVKKETHAIYNKRQFSEYRYSDKITLFSLLSKLQVKYLRHDNFSLYRNSNAVQSVLFINGKIAAMFAGVLNKVGDRVVIPRLAIYMEYSFYSPGYVLLCETMKHVIPNTSIRNIDLCRGTEKYKTDMGGVIYDTVFGEVSDIKSDK